MRLLFSNGSLPLLMCFHDEHIKDLLISSYSYGLLTPIFNLFSFNKKSKDYISQTTIP